MDVNDNWNLIQNRNWNYAQHSFAMSFGHRWPESICGHGYPDMMAKQIFHHLPRTVTSSVRRMATVLKLKSLSIFGVV